MFININTLRKLRNIKFLVVEIYNGSCVLSDLNGDVFDTIDDAIEYCNKHIQTYLFDNKTECIECERSIPNHIKNGIKTTEFNGWIDYRNIENWGYYIHTYRDTLKMYDDWFHSFSHYIPICQYVNYSEESSMVIIIDTPKNILKYDKDLDADYDNYEMKKYSLLLHDHENMELERIKYLMMKDAKIFLPPLIANIIK